MNGERDHIDPRIVHMAGGENLPVAANLSPAAEVIKQIIEQILANERRRARMEFVRMSSFFLVFLLAILGTGIWFAHQLIGQLRDERQLAEQSWRLAFGNVQNASGAIQPGQSGNPPGNAPALNEETVAKLENNISSMDELLKKNPPDSSSIHNMLASQQNALLELNARLNKAHGGLPGPEGAGNKVTERSSRSAFISAPLSDNVKLRMPIPSL